MPGDDAFAPRRAGVVWFPEFPGRVRGSEAKMGSRVRAAVVLAAFGFVATSGWIWLMGSACCTPSSCERCPVTFCKATPANVAVKTDAITAPGAAAHLAPPIVRLQGPAAEAVRAAFSSPHQFRYPMRN